MSAHFWAGLYPRGPKILCQIQYARLCWAAQSTDPLGPAYPKACNLLFCCLLEDMLSWHVQLLTYVMHDHDTAHGHGLKQLKRVIFTRLWP